MKNPNMLYRCPGPESYEGVSCETTIVDEEDVEAHLADGWHRNWIEAGEAHAAALQKLADNEAEQARIAAELAKAGGAGDVGGDKLVLKAVHKGAGKWALVDADGKEVETGLTKDEAQAKAGGAAAQG